MQVVQIGTKHIKKTIFIGRKGSKYKKSYSKNEKRSTALRKRIVIAVITIVSVINAKKDK